MLSQVVGILRVSSEQGGIEGLAGGGHVVGGQSDCGMTGESAFQGKVEEDKMTSPSTNAQPHSPEQVVDEATREAAQPEFCRAQESKRDQAHSDCQAPVRFQAAARAPMTQ